MNSFDLEHILKAIRIGTQSELEQLCREFNTPVLTLVQTQWVTSNCSDIMFINYTPLSVVSGGNIEVNNYILQPGGFVGYSGNNAEVNIDRYNVVFGPNATVCSVLKKLYVKK